MRIETKIDIESRSKADVVVQSASSSDLARSYPAQIGAAETPPITVPTGNGDLEKAFRQAGYRR
jgi:hypothetical protein